MEGCLTVQQILDIKGCNRKDKTKERSGQNTSFHHPPMILSHETQSRHKRENKQ